MYCYLPQIFISPLSAQEHNLVVILHCLQGVHLSVKVAQHTLEHYQFFLCLKCFELLILLEQLGFKCLSLFGDLVFFLFCGNSQLGLS